MGPHFNSELRPINAGTMENHVTKWMKDRKAGQLSFSLWEIFNHFGMTVDQYMADAPEFELWDKFNQCGMTVDKDMADALEDGCRSRAGVSGQHRRKGRE